MGLFNPRTQVWQEHFEWKDGGLTIRGKTPAGRATVAALNLNDDPDVQLVRSFWIEAGWHPPKN